MDSLQPSLSRLFSTAPGTWEPYCVPGNILELELQQD